MSAVPARKTSSDFPAEGLNTKWAETILSPTESEADAHIASYEPQYIEELRRGIAKMKAMSISKLRDAYSPIGVKSVSSDDDASFTDLHMRFIPDPSKDLRLSITTRDIFAEHVKPHQILSYFHKYNADVLDRNDINAVKSVTSMDGDKAGALELYDRLQGYDEWLPCVISVLRDKDVNMNELADLLLLHLGLENASKKVLDNPENHDKLVSLLKDQFRMLLKPLVILPLFHKYDPHVLVQEDMDVVASITRQDGDVIGSDELLDRLVKYPGWYPCLMNVLRDPLVGLEEQLNAFSDSLANEFKEIRDAEEDAKNTLISNMKEYERRFAEKKKKAKVFSDSDEGSHKDRVKRERAALERGEQEQMALEAGKKVKGRKSLRDEVMDGSTALKWTGLDSGKPLAPHKLSHLPLETDLVQQKLQYLRDMEMDVVIPEPGLHKRMFDPWLEGEKYMEKFAITELLTFMLTRLVLEEPKRPVDYLIGLARDINKLDNIRQEVDQMAEDKKNKKKAKLKAKLEEEEMRSLIIETSSFHNIETATIYNMETATIHNMETESSHNLETDSTQIPETDVTDQIETDATDHTETASTHQSESQSTNHIRKSNIHHTQKNSVHHKRRASVDHAETSSLHGHDEAKDELDSEKEHIQ